MIDDVTIVHASGPLRDVGAQLIQLVDELGFRRLVLDLREVHGLGSACLASLLRLHRWLTAREGELKVCGMPPDLVEVTMAASLDRMLPNDEDEQAALDSL